MTLLRALEPFVARQRRGGGQRCELCSALVENEHPHLADVERRVLVCACRACALLFTGPGAAAGRFRTVPDRYRLDPSFALDDAQWDALGIPVAMAFFFKSSSARAWTAVYPSPAGPVESLLRLEAWEAIASGTTLVEGIEPDVEALLVTAKSGGDGGYECMLVPIHACYALVGEVRRRWRGLDGGEEARSAVAAHLGALRARCVRAEGAPS
jgi:hypothetical protein